MREQFKIRSKAPWSNQEANMFVRFLAIIYVLCVVFVINIVIYYSIVDGVDGIENAAYSDLLFVYGMLIFGIYSALIVGHVAIKGRAPSGWRPW